MHESRRKCKMNERNDDDEKVVLNVLSIFKT